jgi:hypothetical protein
MDQDQAYLLPAALRWDSNGDLGSEALRCLLDRLQAQAVTLNDHQARV